MWCGNGHTGKLTVVLRDCLVSLIRANHDSLWTCQACRHIYFPLPDNINLSTRNSLLFFYGCETWSLTLREERRLRVSENRVLRRIFGPKRNEVKREWRKQNNEELNDLHCSSNIIWKIKSRKMIRTTYVACMGERRSVYRV